MKRSSYSFHFFGYKIINIGVGDMTIILTMTCSLIFMVMLTLLSLKVDKKWAGDGSI